MEKILDQPLPTSSFVEPDYNQEENTTPPHINADDILRDMVSANGGSISKIKASKEPHPGSKQQINTKSEYAAQSVQSTDDIVKSIQRSTPTYRPDPPKQDASVTSPGEVLMYSLAGVVVVGVVGYFLFSRFGKSEFPKPKAPKPRNPNVQIEVIEVEEEPEQEESQQ